MDSIQDQYFHQISKSLPELSVTELEELMKQIINLRKQKLPTVLSQPETILLKKINTGITDSIQKRYNYLVKKRKEETLNNSELDELIELTAYTESHNVQRLGYILELANLRNKSLDEMVEELEIKPKLYVA